MSTWPADSQDCHDCSGAAPEGERARGQAPEEAPQEALERQAATWAVRHHGGLDPDGLARLQAWLSADPRHLRAFDAMSATLRGVRQMPAQDAARLRAGLPESVVPRRSSAKPSATKPPAWWSLRPFVPHAAAAVVVLALAGAGWFSWWQQPTFAKSYATQRGQQLLATLPDDAAAGSTVQLDTGTRVHARLFRNRREVELRDGQAMFAVHADKDRPFHVFAGGLRITVVGTRFSVRHTQTGIDAGRTVVAVEEGQVRVERAQAAGSGAGASGSQAPAQQATSVELHAGQMLEGSGGADGGPELGTVRTVAPQAVAPWRNDRISFSQTPLAQALAEFERYGNTGLVVRDPAVAALPVGGSYSLRQHQRFAEFLPQLLPVRLVQRNGVTEIVAR
jgi:transmembrane sensor